MKHRLCNFQACKAMIVAAAFMAWGIANASAQVASVDIGHGLNQPGGIYVNAQSIADTLVFTDLSIVATSDISIVDDVDMTASIYGTPFYTLTFDAPTFNLDHNLIMHPAGHVLGVVSTADTINLTGRITFGTSLGDATRLSSPATLINVLANSASIQQAIDFSSTTDPVTVQVSTGQYNESLAIDKSLTLASDSGAHLNSGEFHLASSGVSVTVTGDSFTNAGGGALSGRGTLDLTHLTIASLENHGTVLPGSSPGTLAITGAYNQAGDGELEIEIGGTTADSQYDQLAVTGLVNLDGFLHVNLINGFTPDASDTFTIVTSSGLSGDFSNAPSTIAAGDGTFSVVYGPTSVQLVNFQIPEPSSLGLMVLGGLILPRRRGRLTLRQCVRG